MPPVIVVSSAASFESDAPGAGGGGAGAGGSSTGGSSMDGGTPGLVVVHSRYTRGMLPLR